MSTIYHLECNQQPSSQTSIDLISVWKEVQYMMPQSVGGDIDIQQVLHQDVSRLYNILSMTVRLRKLWIFIPETWAWAERLFSKGVPSRLTTNFWTVRGQDLRRNDHSIESWVCAGHLTSCYDIVHVLREESTVDTKLDLNGSNFVVKGRGGVRSA